jgi:hypothetical protein
LLVLQGVCSFDKIKPDLLMPDSKKIPLEKFIAIDDEIRTSIKLIQSGLAELQNINLGNDFYYLPFMLLSAGFEKLLKLYICFYHWEHYGKFPTIDDFKKSKKDNGHDLIYLKNKVTTDYFVANTPELKEDLDALNNNQTLNQLINFLGDFGQYSRYYNLDVIISKSNQKSKDIRQLWEQLETQLLHDDSFLFSRFKNNLNEIDKYKLEDIRNIDNEVRTKIIILFEVFARALTRQFTLGKLGQAKMFLH